MTYNWGSKHVASHVINVVVLDIQSVLYFIRKSIVNQKVDPSIVRTELRL